MAEEAPDVSLTAESGEMSPVSDFSGMDAALADFDFDFESPSPTERAKKLMARYEHVSFTFGVVNVLVLAYLVGAEPWLLPLYFTIKFPILLGARLVMYSSKHLIYFMADPCYFVNTALLIYLWAFPHSREMFTVLFALSTGPLAWAIWLFRNSLVFHSVDKITSCYIHVSPMLVTYAIRWRQGGHWNDALLSYDVCPSSDSSCSSLLWTLVVPLACYAAHQVLYYLVFYVCFPIPDGYLNTFRYITRSGPLAALRKRPGGWAIFGLINVTATAVMIAPTYLWYHHHVAHFVFCCVVVVICVHNGSMFYMRVFKNTKQNHEHLKTQVRRASTRNLAA